MPEHRFLAADTAACFTDVTTAQVRADLAEIETTGCWQNRPGWVQRVYEHHAVHTGGMSPHADLAVNAGLRFIADRERAEIAGRLRAIVDRPDLFECVHNLADELDPKD